MFVRLTRCDHRSCRSRLCSARSRSSENGKPSPRSQAVGKTVGGSAPLDSFFSTRYARQGMAQELISSQVQAFPCRMARARDGLSRFESNCQGPFRGVPACREAPFYPFILKFPHVVSAPSSVVDPSRHGLNLVQLLHLGLVHSFVTYQTNHCSCRSFSCFQREASELSVSCHFWLALLFFVVFANRRHSFRLLDLQCQLNLRIAPFFCPSEHHCPGDTKELKITTCALDETDTIVYTIFEERHHSRLRISSRLFPAFSFDTRPPCGSHVHSTRRLRCWPGHRSSAMLLPKPRA